MPTLLIQQAGQSRGVVLTGRVLIGRAAPGGIAIIDGSVSRIHAWIDREDDHFYIADAASRTGTIVGEHGILNRHVLEEGDRITIGPATITYHDEDVLPGNVDEELVTQTNGAPVAAAGGILFACSCGAPLWAPTDWAGKKGKCAQCGERTPIPQLTRRDYTPGIERPQKPKPATTIEAAPLAQPKPKAPQPQNQPAVAAKQCSICQWAIQPDEEQTSCPTCNLTFHADCWAENRGCSAYGCASVEALATEEEKEAAVAQTVEVPEEAPERFPVEFALLGGSVLGSLAGLPAFGIPAALIGVGANIYWLLGKRRGDSINVGAVAAAIAMSLAGLAAGVWLSSVWWLHRPMGAPWQHG